MQYISIKQGINNTNEKIMSPICFKYGILAIQKGKIMVSICMDL